MVLPYLYFQVKHWLKAKLQEGFGLRFIKDMPRGFDLSRDLRTLTDFRVRTILDVGANVGEVAMGFRKSYPEAVIHCFEPASVTFEMLTANVGRLSQVYCHQVAFGAERGRQPLCVDLSDLALSRILEEPCPEAEMVSVETLDGFCDSRGLVDVDLLKIDTEGHDLEVLRGARNLLASRRINLIECEVGFSRDNEVHVPFEVLSAELSASGYELFAFYEQVGEWKQRRPHLRRANAVFLSQRLVQATSSVF